MPSDLTLPASEQVVQGSTTDLSGITFNDSFAAGNSGELYLSITDSSGDLTATDSGGVVPGSGTNAITLDATYADVQAILSSLAYIAPDSPSSDTISIDLWDQDGVESTGTIPVSVSGGGTTETWTGAAGDGEWNTAGNWSDDAVPTSGDTVLIAPTTTNVPSLADATLTGETILLNSSSPVGPSVFFNDVTLGAGTVLKSGGSGGSIGDLSTLTVASGATITNGDGTALGIDNFGSSPVTLINNGAIIESGNSSGGISLDLTVENHGVISGSSAAGNELPIGDGQDILNNGGTIIDAGGIIDLNGAVQGGTVAFTGSGGSLLLGALDPFGQGAVISGFGDDDRIEFGSFNPTNMYFISPGTLGVIGGSVVGFAEAIPFAGTLGLGNFELNNTTTGANGTPATTLLYAPFGGPAGAASGEPDISAPGTASVAQGNTLALNGVSITNASTLTLQITSNDGATLYMDGASGNGTQSLTIAADTPASQVNADLATLRYVPVAGTTSDMIDIRAGAPILVTGTSETLRIIPVTITPGSSGPTLTEPSSESVTPNSTTPVSGSYADSFAQGNPGDMFIGISDSNGTLSAKDASGNVVTGSGTDQITLSTDYKDLNAVLGSLTYTAGANTGSDTIDFDIWNQAGVETTGTVSVAVSGGSAGPTLTEPDSETVSTNGSTAVGGSYGDSFAQNNPGQLFLSISDSSGTLTSQDTSGQAVIGSGTNSIAVSTDYVNLNAILAHLHYTAGANAGSDSIQFQVWNQAGVATTGSTAVTIGAPANSVAMSAQDFAPPVAVSDVTGSSLTGSSTSAFAVLNDVQSMPSLIPPHLGH
jgi:hypothetical protein